MAQSTASTSQKLQPWDKEVNKTFQHVVKETREKICKASMTDTKSIRIKLMCAVQGFASITVEDVKISFSKTGLWAMDLTFAEQFRKASDFVTVEARKHKARLERAGPASRIPSVVKRHADHETLKEVEVIVGGPDGVSLKLQAVQRLLNSRDTVHTILSKLCPKTGSTRASDSTCRSDNVPKSGDGGSATLICGTPALYLTHKDVLERRRAKIEAARNAALAKEQEKARRAEEKRKAAEENAAKRVASEAERARKRTERVRAAEGKAAQRLEKNNERRLKRAEIAGNAEKRAASKRAAAGDERAKKRSKKDGLGDLQLAASRIKRTAVSRSMRRPFRCRS